MRWPTTALAVLASWLVPVGLALPDEVSREGSAGALSVTVPFYRRHGKRSFDRDSWLTAERARLLGKYVGQKDTEGHLQGRQIVSATFTGLPSSATSPRPSSTAVTGNPNGTLFRGVSDGRGGVVGLQRTLNFQADL